MPRFCTAITAIPSVNGNTVKTKVWDDRPIPAHFNPFPSHDCATGLVEVFGNHQEIDSGVVKRIITVLSRILRRYWLPGKIVHIGFAPVVCEQFRVRLREISLETAIRFFARVCTAYHTILRMLALYQTILVLSTTGTFHRSGFSTKTDGHRHGR